jgi:acyl-coenzyme A thioesterase PaaI-like protein
MGSERKDGLQLEMTYENGCVFTDFVVDNRFEGYKDVVHGGMTFGVLDTILWSIIFMETKKLAMTKKVEMEFIKPLLCNTHYCAKSRLLSVEEKDIRATAWIEDAQGEVYARVDAVFREGKGMNPASLVKRYDFSAVPQAIKDHFLSAAKGE